MGDIRSADRLHRLEKLLLETGEAETPGDARRILAGYTMQFVVGSDCQHSTALQVALLTAVNTARRAIHGDVRVVSAGCDLDEPLLVPFAGRPSIGEAVLRLGGSVHTTASEDIPTLVLAASSSAGCSVTLQATCRGWAGGVVPIEEAKPAIDPEATTLAGAIAGAIGVSELFQALRGTNGRAGLRSIGLSAWDPSLDWESDPAVGPSLQYLPAAIWLVGLGHLGQSLLWNLGFLPYPDRRAVELVLQDFDRVKTANVSTSPLTFDRDVGRMKTRVVSQWAEDLGFSTRIVERAFGAPYTLNADEPRLMFCGVDNAEARAGLEDPGFEAAVEAGLGTGDEYHAFQLHTFPGPQAARERWARSSGHREPRWSKGLEALSREQNLDACGRTELAGLQVASSYVGVATTALALGQMLRPLHGERMHASISGTLGNSAPPTGLVGEVGRTGPRYAYVEAAVPST